MRNLYLCILVLIVFAVQGNSQANFKPGYVILNSGDTLKGQIDYRGDKFLNAFCVYRASENSPVISYSPNDISSYRFEKSRCFVSKDLPGDTTSNKVFLEYIINGKLSVYYFRDKLSEDHYYIEKEGLGISQLPYKNSIVYKDDVPYFYESTNHLGILNYYTQDAPELSSKIFELKEPTDINLIKITEEYQNLVCKDQPCIVYKRELPFIKVSLEPTFGLIKYNTTENFAYEYGCLFNLWAPRSNERLYFQTGFLYDRLVDVGYKNEEFFDTAYNYNIYKIPLRFLYLYPSKIFRPKISFGSELVFIDYTERNDSVSGYQDQTYGGILFGLTPGFNINITPKFAISVGVNFDFTPIISVFMGEFDFISYSINTGLYIKL